MYLPPENRKKLKKVIAIEGSTYRKVAAAAGWNGPSMVAHLVSGRRNSVKDQVALKIAKHLDVDVNDLFVTKLSHDDAQPAPAAKRTASRKTAA